MTCSHPLIFLLIHFKISSVDDLNSSTDIVFNKIYLLDIFIYPITALSLATCLAYMKAPPARAKSFSKLGIAI